MGRLIAAVVVGYLAMSAFVFTTFSLAYLAIGAERAFKPGSYEVSALWLVGSFALGFVGALAGGWVCAAIGRSARAVKALAVVVVVLGIALAVPAMLGRSTPAPRSAAVGNMEAMQRAQTPRWVALLNPLVAVAGVLIAGRRKLPSAP
jgi:hypothetical protein